MSTEVIRAPRVEIRDEGTTQGQARAIDFTGSGVSVSVSAGVATVVVSGGGGGSFSMTDADGTTAVAQKTDRLVPLSRVTSFGAAAVLGTLETGAGDSTVQFTTPLVIHPGEFLKIGLRTTFVTAAVTSGTLDGAINVNGYWD